MGSLIVVLSQPLFRSTFSTIKNKTHSQPGSRGNMLYKKLKDGFCHLFYDSYE